MKTNKNKNNKNGNRGKSVVLYRPRQAPIRLPNASTNRPPPMYTSPMPATSIHYITFDKPVSVYNNPGGSVVSDGIYLNNIFDFLTGILTSEAQYVAFLYLNYGFAKVLSIRVYIKFGNLEQVPFDLYYFASAQTMAVGLKTQIEQLVPTPVCVWRGQISEQYGKESQTSMDKVILPYKVLGNKLEYMADNDFSCTASAGPPNSIRGLWCAASPLATITTGITVSYTFVAKVKFYDANVLTSALPKPLLSHDYMSSHFRKFFEYLEKLKKNSSEFPSEFLIGMRSDGLITISGEVTLRVPVIGSEEVTPRVSEIYPDEDTLKVERTAKATLQETLQGLEQQTRKILECIKVFQDANQNNNLASIGGKCEK